MCIDVGTKSKRNNNVHMGTLYTVYIHSFFLMQVTPEKKPPLACCIMEGNSLTHREPCINFKAVATVSSDQVTYQVA